MKPRNYSGSIRFSSARLLGLALVTLFFAQSSIALAQGTGTIAGVVRNEQTGANLEGAEVTVAGTALRVRTDRSGAFILPQVPTGQQTLRIFYTGLDARETTVTVPAGTQTTVDIALNSAVYELEAFAVSGEREGNAVSIMRQRAAENVMNVVSMDAYGSVADGNIGNFLQNLPGLAVNKEAGDIVGVGMRGTPPELNSVTLDGTRTAAAIAGFTPQGDRAALIDQIPSEFIKEIEVIKGTLPEHPADSLGGSINLVSKSAFDFQNRVITYRAGVTANTYRKDLSKRFSPTLAFSYMDAFGSNRQMGIAISGSYSETTNTRDRVQMNRPFEDGRNTTARTLDDITTRVRSGLGAKFEYRIDPTLTVWASASLNRYTSEMDRVNFQASAGASSRIADYNVVSRAQIEAGVQPRTTTGLTAGIAPGFTPTFTELLHANWTNQVAHESKRSVQYKIAMGAEKKWANATLSIGASHNPSEFDNVFYGFTTTMNGVIGMVIDTNADVNRPIYRQSYGPSIAAGSDLNRYLASWFENGWDRTEEDISNVHADLEHRFSGLKFPVSVKTGLDYRRQHRWWTTYRPSWNYVGPDGVRGVNSGTGINDDNLAQFTDMRPSYSVMNNDYPRRDKFNLALVEAARLQNPSHFAPVGTSLNSLTPPRIATEEVSSAYVQGNVRFGELTFIGGVRVEQTDVDAQGSFQDAQNPDAPLIRRKGEYTKIFPSIHLRYEATRNLIMRASFSTGSGRPSIGAIVPNTTISHSEESGLGRVTQNNPGLNPNYSKNYDLSAEYYFEPAGVVSAGVFRKNIADYIATFNSIVPDGQNNGFGGEYAGYDYVTQGNLGGEAKIEGIELNYNQQLRMLPAPFNSMSVFANYTKLKTEGNYGEGITELTKFVPETYNVGLSFNWRQLGVRTAYHFKSAFLNTYNVDPFQRVTVGDDPTVDINLQYKWRPGLSFFVDYINIFNKSPNWYTAGNKERVVMSELYGARLSVGINGRF